MAYEQLRHFVEKLRADGDLVEIGIPVSPDLEITEITDRVCKTGGPALLFSHPVGSEIPLLIKRLWLRAPHGRRAWRRLFGLHRRTHTRTPAYNSPPPAGGSGSP